MIPRHSSLSFGMTSDTQKQVVILALTFPVMVEVPAVVGILASNSHV